MKVSLEVFMVNRVLATARAVVARA